MTAREVRDVAVSVHQRLLDLDPDRKEEFTTRLTRYALERFLYRLSRSAHVEKFVLKGAMLFCVWADGPHRATRDLDLLGLGETGPDWLKQVFAEICSIAVEADGLTFDATTVSVAPIRENQDLQGSRVTFVAHMKKMRIRLQVDVGHGDAVFPEPEIIAYPTLLAMPGPLILAYCKETVIAEKFAAMVALGIKNSRMKDFYDVAVIADRFPFAGPLLSRTVAETFRQRGVRISNLAGSTVLAEGFGGYPDKQVQWRAFLNRTQLTDIESDFDFVAARIRKFLQPVAMALVHDEPFPRAWPPGGPWSAGEKSQVIEGPEFRRSA